MLQVFLILAIFLAFCNPQTIPQCSCSQLQPCLNMNADTFFNCGDECQSHVGAMSFNYGAARQCFEQIRGPMNQAIACFEKFYDGTCATGEPQMVQPTDIEIFKLTLYSRLESMLSNSGVLNQVVDFVASSKKFTGCTIQCISKLTPFGCEQQNNCGLNVPSDDVIVNNMVQCAIQSGVNTQAVQSLCHCLAQTGNQQIDSICDQLVVQ